MLILILIKNECHVFLINECKIINNVCHVYLIINALLFGTNQDCQITNANATFINNGFITKINIKKSSIEAIILS